jgi:hypothetical protein
MSLLDRLFGRKAQPRARVRICVECGMPVAEHKDWCSIFRTQQEIDRKAAGAAAEAKPPFARQES